MNRATFDNVCNKELTPLQKKVLNLFLEEGLSDEEILSTLAKDKGRSSLDRTVLIHHIKNIMNTFKKFAIISENDSDHRESLVKLSMKYRPELVCQKVRERYNIVGYSWYPEGVVPFDSGLYIEREEFDAECYKFLKQPGTLVRIRAPKQMGKTSMIKRIKSKAQNDGTQCVEVNLSQFEILESTTLNTFLQKLYKYFLQELNNIEFDKNRYDDISDLIYFTLKFQAILRQINSDLILIFDEVDTLFKYPNIYQEFFAMLRNWHSDRAQDSEQSHIWGKLKIVLAFSTEDYGRLRINQSPFNVGKPFQLVDLTDNQINILAKRYSLERDLEPAFEKLRKLVGGHPYLLQLGLYSITKRELEIDQLISESIMNGGIYKTHLEMLLDILKNNPNLGLLYRKILSEKVVYAEIDAFEYKRLDHMGLIKTEKEIILPRRVLYKLYFHNKVNSYSVK